MLRRQCTPHYKLDVIRLAVRTLLGLGKGERAAGKKKARALIGISYDELERMKTSTDVWTENTYPLVDARMTRDDCVATIKRHGIPVPPKSSCVFCLSGDTEVVTRKGIKPIRDLAGGVHELLIPTKGKLGGLSSNGSFREAQVKAFGKQALYEVSLARGRSKKTIHATAEHRWFVAPGAQWSEIETSERTTLDLLPGDKLRPLVASPVPAEKDLMMRVAVAQGFVFGDGSVSPQDNRPACVAIYASKDEALIPFLNGLGTSDARHRENTAGERAFVYGLPRTWKELPSIGESRSFLLSWLAGYFAADGTVNKSGKQAVLYSASLENVKFARDVAAVCGIGYMPIRSRIRIGFGVARPLHCLGLQLDRLPEWFFILTHHRRRAEALRDKRRNMPWQVVSVNDLGIAEDVFCAVEVGAFGLADDLMTGNCPYHSDAQWLWIKQNDHDAWQRACAVDEAIRDPDSKKILAGKEKQAAYLHRSRLPLAQVDFEAKARADKAQTRLFEQDGFVNECEGLCGV